MLITHISQAIGNTPLLEISPALHGLKNIRLLAKLECLNPGSLKDRAAWYLLKDELDRLKAAGGTVIESTSGNTGIAMQMLCSAAGVPFRIVTNRMHVQEIKDVLLLRGADLMEMPATSSCPDPTDPGNPFAIIERMVSAEPGKFFHPSQYTNERNRRAHYETTGPEIDADAGGQIDYLIGGLGTAGSTSGAGDFLKEKNPDLKLIGVISQRGEVNPGIRNGDEMGEVGLFEKRRYDDIVVVSQADALDAMRQLILRTGVSCGPTSGAVFAGALKHLATIDAVLTRRSTACIILPDRVELYLSWLKKLRPQWFKQPAKKESLETVSVAQIQAAPTITVAQAEQWTADPAMLIIDMRGSLAFKAGHIAGSINMAEDLLKEQAERGLPVPPTRRLLLVCPVGEQSRRFAAFFKACGIDCASLEGGFTAWRDAGKPIERQAPRPS